MGQIVKKKKGRPSKADLAARVAAAAESNDRHLSQRRRETAGEEQDDVCRSLRRRRCVRYSLFDYDEDYLEDDEEFEVDDEEGFAVEEGAENKFVLKLPNSIRRRSELEGEEEEDGEEEEENPVSKRRKISGDGDEKDDYGANEDEKEAGGKGGSNKEDFIRAVLNDVPSQTPMPEKKQLELILDKLQKKDTYGVYAEPVDLEELPDYHDVIKHPMDFATVRNKHSDGSYSIFEQFENDVFLICSNAMQYNAPDTIYHKQAHTIKELAQKKFERVRAGIERTRIENGQTEKEPMSEHKTKLNPVMKKQMKKPIGCSAHDPVSYGFSSGATLATTDSHNTKNGVLVSNCERPSNNDGVVEGVSPLAEGNAEKVEELQSGKGITHKVGKKPLVVDENRRGTYEISIQPVDRSDSIFSTFQGEDKQLIPVGLYGEHSYAQSLVRFAATLGPIAWRIASKRIERALPPGSKFGRGWVVEYEPLPTPVLFVASQPHKEYSFATKPQNPALSEKNDKPNGTMVTLSEQLDVGGHTSDGRPCLLPRSGGSRPATPSGTVVQQQIPTVRKPQNAAFPVKVDKPSDNLAAANDHGENRPVSDAKPPQLPNFGGSKPATPTGAAIQQQNPFVRRLQNASVSGIIDESPESVVTSGGRLDNGSGSEGKSSILPNSRGSRPITPTGVVTQPHNPFSRNNLRPENMVRSRVEANSPTNQKANFFVQKQFPVSGEMASSWQVDMIARNKNFLQPVPLRPIFPANQGAFTGEFPNGNRNGSVDFNRMASSSSCGASAQVLGTKTSFPPRQEHGLSDPVQVMRLMDENAQKQNKTNGLLGPSQVRPFILSPRGGNTSRAITPASSSWMSVGAGVNKPPVGNLGAHSNQNSAESLYNKTPELYPRILQPGEHPVPGTRHFQPERGNFPFQEHVSNPAKASTEAQLQNRQMVFPQLLTDLSRVPLQSPSQALSPHTQQEQKQDTLPPDLNISFQSKIDPQQPDLALQL